METLKQLQDYANTTDNVYLQRKLELIEREIETLIHAERMKVYDTCYKMQ